MKGGFTMFRHLTIVFTVLFLVSGHVPAGAGTAEFWRTFIAPTRNAQEAVSDIWIGAVPGCHDGYDEQPQAQIWGSGIAVAHYRQTGPNWSGPEGFYWEDYESPIPAGASHTWPNIYLWAQDYAVPGDTADIGFGLEFPPPGYTAHLVLDYVPESLQWTGQTDFWLDLTQESVITLPVLEVSDGLQGTRMHLTVYAPVPEPSSLIALAGGLAGLGGMALRRRRG